MSSRVVITGLGVVAPSGTTVDEHLSTITAGRPCIDRITRFDAASYPVQVAGEVRGDVQARVPSRIAVQTDRWTWMGLAATDDALRDAGLDLTTVDPYDVAVVMASSSGGNEFGQNELQRLWRDPSRTVSAYQSIAWFYAASVGQIAIAHQAKGPSTVVVSEAAGGLDSLAQAVRAVRHGTPIVLAGAIEAPLSPYALTCHLAHGGLAHSRGETDVYKPFDSGARGWIPGEGGAVFVVEDLEHARARGAHVYAEISGHAATHDGVHTGTREPACSIYYAHAMQQALERAGASANEVDVFVPDAAGLPYADHAEVEAVHRVFGGRTVPVSTHKALVGRMCQGGSALDVAEASLAIDRATLFASSAPASPAPDCDLAFVGSTVSAPVTTALIGARGFDGFNAALVLRSVPEPDLIGAT